MTTIHVTKVGHKLEVDVPYDSGYIKKAKRIGGRWNSEKGVWVFSQENEAEVKKILTDSFDFDGVIEVSKPKNLTFDYEIMSWDRVDILLKVDETIISTLGELKRKGPNDRWLFYGKGQPKELEQEFMESFYKIYDDYVAMIPGLVAHDNKIRTVSYKLYEMGIKESDKPVDK